jgi:hypothetical protein
MSIPTSRARLLIIVVPFQFSAEPVRASERCKRTEVSGTLVSSASPQPTSLVAGASPQRLVIPPVDPQPQLRPPHTVDERHTTDPIPARHGHDIDALETFDRRRPDGRHTGASDECESTSSTTSTSGESPCNRSCEPCATPLSINLSVPVFPPTDMPMPAQLTP